MGKVWLAERWKVLLPQLQRLGVAEEEEIARLCEAEVRLPIVPMSEKGKETVRAALASAGLLKG